MRIMVRKKYNNIKEKKMFIYQISWVCKNEWVKNRSQNLHLYDVCECIIACIFHESSYIHSYNIVLCVVYELNGSNSRLTVFVMNLFVLFVWMGLFNRNFFRTILIKCYSDCIFYVLVNLLLTNFKNMLYQNLIHLMWYINLLI